MKLFIITISLFLSGIVNAQHEYLDHPIDIIHYDVTLELDDTTDVIQGYELITFELESQCDSFFIDLASRRDTTGMKVHPQMLIDYQDIDFRHENDRIWIQTPTEWEVGSIHELKIYYQGVPETGLIIGKNKFGNRTFFGDNWPNRAHHWFACVDHPSDKATIKYTVVAPTHYQCIATGTIISRQLVYQGKKMKYEYVTSIDLPTKVMVIGVANFFWDIYKPDPGFDVAAWVYPENKDEGLSDMKVAVEIVEYFMNTIGDYPFEKLANVQSTTQYGGMENAGNIFYDENAITGEGTMEALIAHEIAHQWFGNSASEEDWSHLWLSEGFATYFTDLYWEHKYGRDAMIERLKGERMRVLQFAQNYYHPVVDTEYEDLMQLLNPNSYQKGAWFLHMLREKIGDEAFFEGIREYYEAYQYDNANTKDFRHIMEGVSGAHLTYFFEQWLHTPGHPVLLIESQIKNKKAEFTIKQTQENIFQFDLELEVIYENGDTELITIPVDSEETSLPLETKTKITGYRIDPNVKLLFEEVEY